MGARVVDDAARPPTALADAEGQPALVPAEPRPLSEGAGSSSRGSRGSRSPPPIGAPRGLEEGVEASEDGLGEGQLAVLVPEEEDGGGVRPRGAVHLDLALFGHHQVGEGAAVLGFFVVCVRGRLVFLVCVLGLREWGRRCEYGVGRAGQGRGGKSDLGEGRGMGQTDGQTDRQT